jgi:hypothetical protein
VRALVLLFVCGLATARADGIEAGDWDFAATLNGKPIGTHRFVVGGTATAPQVDSQARFLVRILGVPVYRYSHNAQERWQGDCLRELRSETDNDGKARRVNQRFEGDCTMGFAYWNPRLPAQQRLVDPQTGKAEAVRIERLPDAAIEARGSLVPAQGWRLHTANQRISVWYAASGGRWIALDADVDGGRKLSYRLPPISPIPTDKDKP